MQINDLLALLPKGHQQRTAILDSNLLVLLITYAVDAKLLPTLKRTKGFSVSDAELLLWLLGQFRSSVTTAYALAEVSNLGNELSGWKRTMWYDALATFACATHEAHVSTTIVGASKLFVRFGATDAALGILSDDHVLLTAEHRLSAFLTEAGKQAINFNHLRFAWI